MICEKCGTENDENAKFCCSCGSTIEKKVIEIGDISVNNDFDIPSSKNVTADFLANKKKMLIIIASVIIAFLVVVAVFFSLQKIINKPLIDASEKHVAILSTYPDGGDFTQVDISSYTLPETVTEVYSASNGGYVVKLLTSGYGSDMVLMCGIDANGTVTGATCLSSTETLGYEKTYGDSLAGKTVEDIDLVEAISGATKTTAAYKNAVKDALNATIILGGGSVDIRSEEEILNDNLKEALPAGEGKFVSWFIVEELENVTAVYEAENGTGYVLVSGEEFIAIDKTGAVLTTVADDVKAVMEANAQKILNSTLTEIDITGYSDMPTHVKKAYKTASGNYVFDLEAKGFGINGDAYYNPSGKPIELKASATKDGKVIAVLTTAQYETDGIGSACMDASFYTQFNGKTEADYGEIDAISGATITSNAYITAVSQVFEAIEILQNDNKTIITKSIEFKESDSNSILSNIYDSGEINKYGPQNVLDSSLSTCWAEGEDGFGKGCYIKLYGDELVTVNTIDIVNGYSKSEELFYKNNRVKELCISFSDGTKKNVVLNGEFSDQPNHIVLDKPVKTTYIKFEIVSVYNGNAYDDTCISEIVVW